MRPQPHLLYLVPFVLGASVSAQITYVESSFGLDEPGMESGGTEFEFGDVDGDGHADMVSVGDHGSPYVNTDQHGAMIWFGDGTGRWSLSQFGEFGYGGVALGDVDGDGVLDIGYGVHHDYGDGDLGDQLLEVALGDGTGRFTPWDDGLATAGETWGMFGTDFADVDGDGDLDIGSISFGCCAGVHVYLNGGDGTWEHSFGFLDGNSDQEFVFGDVNGDGHVDVAAGHQFGSVYLGDGDGGFVPGDGNLPPADFTGRSGIALGDVDDDGADDLAWADGGLHVWRLDPVTELWSDWSGDLPKSGGWEGTQLWDMDGDGLTDLAAYGDTRFALWLGDGDGGWTPTTTFTVPGPGDLAAFRAGADVDHNGQADFVLVTEEGGGPFGGGVNTPRVFLETSNPDRLTVRLVRPEPNAALRPGSVRFIDWASAVPNQAESTIDLAYSVDGPDGPWAPIALGVPNNGRFQWTVPDLEPTNDLRLGARVVSDGAREIVIGPELRIETE